MSEENVFDNIQGVTYHFSKEGLLEDWREEALRHREEIERLNKRINELEDRLQIIRNNECEKLAMKAARLGIPSSQLLYKSQELKGEDKK